MGNNDLDFELWLRSKFDGTGTTQASAGVEKVGTSAHTASTGVNELKTALAELVAAAAVITFLKDATEGALEMEKALRLVDMTAAKMGLGVEETREKVQKFASELSELAGVEDDEIVKAVGKAFAATGDLGQAMARAAIAADLATRHNRDYGEMADIVAEAARGKTKALEKLEHVTIEGKDATKKAANAMTFLEKNVRGATSATNDHVIQAARLHAQWKEFKDTVGEQVLKVFDWLRDGLFQVGNGIGLVIAKTANWASAALDIMGALGTAMKQAATGHFKEAEGYFDKVKEIGKRTIELNQLAEDDAEKRDRAYFEGKKKRIQDLVTEQLKANKKIDNEGAGGKGDYKNDPVIELENFRQEQLRKIREKMEDEAKAAEKRRLEYEKQLRQEGLAYTKKVMSEEERAREAASDRMTKLIVEEVRMKKAAAEHEKAMQLEVANAAVGLAGQMFGESKALAIAQAVINTYEGATKALSQGGIYGPVLAAIVIASGLAQVAKISSTNPDRTAGSGFDDPRNDAAAYLGGRRWAADMIGEWTKGVSSGWASGMGSQTNNTTNDNRRTFNVHMHGAGLIDPNNVQMAKQFKRTLDLIDVQIDGQRATARR